MITEAALIFREVALIFAFVIQLATRRHEHRIYFLRFTTVLSVVGWLTFASVVTYWRFYVTPGLDSSVGSGVGFGYVLIHRVIFYLAVIATFSAVGALFGHLVKRKNVAEQVAASPMRVDQ